MTRRRVATLAVVLFAATLLGAAAPPDWRDLPTRPVPRTMDHRPVTADCGGPA